MANSIPDLGEEAALAAIRVPQKHAAAHVRRKSGNLSEHIGSPDAVSVRRTGDGAEATLNSGVPYDGKIEELDHHYENAFSETQDEQRRAVEEVINRAIKNL